jgi:glucose/arabinose dehydrogenase
VRLAAIAITGWLLVAWPAAAVAQEAESEALPQLRAELLVEGLTAPIDLVSPDDGTRRRFLVDQSGLVQLLAADGQVVEPPFLDLRDRMVQLIEGFDERGLLGVAFHPRYAENGRFFVSYSAPLGPDAPKGWNYTRRISEFTVSAGDPDVADPKSERVLLEQDWPSRKHNGGGLAFGPDHLLYIGLGDAGGIHGVGPDVLFEAFDVPRHLGDWDRLAQDTSSLYGKILRIDVDRGYPGYGIPPLNPFVGIEGRDEIYGWGFRNPFRFSFDGARCSPPRSARRCGKPSTSWTGRATTGGPSARRRTVSIDGIRRRLRRNARRKAPLASRSSIRSSNMRT